MSGEEEERIPVSSWPPPDQEDAGNEERDEGRKRKSDEEEKPFKRRSVEDSKEEFSCESVEVLLARWYRQEGSSLRMKYPNLPKPGAASPHTVLHLAAATGEGAQVLREGLRRLEEGGGKNTFLYHYHRARILDRLGEHESALSSNWTALAIAGVDSRQLRDLPATRYLDVAATLGEERRAALWLQYRLQHQLHLTQHTSTSTSTTSPSLSLSPSGLVVARVEAAALTRERFLKEFAGPRLPLLITGSPRPTRHQWSLEHLRRVAGHCKVQARSPLPGSREWGGLEAGREGALGDILAGGFPTPGSYLFDWSLPLHCPKLAGDFIVPQIVAGENYLTLTSPSALYHNSWPSLFVASAGTNSGLHIDAFGSHFWMYLVEGRKRWTFYPAGQVSSLGAVFPDSMDPVFLPTQAQLDSTPHYSIDLEPGQILFVPSGCPHSIDLEPGQILFVPSGCPHRVENLESSIAVSGNFVNRTNIGETEEHLRIAALQDPRAGDLLRELHHLGLLEAGAV